MSFASWAAGGSLEVFFRSRPRLVSWELDGFGARAILFDGGLALRPLGFAQSVNQPIAPHKFRRNSDSPQQGKKRYIGFFADEVSPRRGLVSTDDD